ncbi:VWA domain-containing protein [Paenibacillus popilliae]|uniref:non-specific serine/threonine protein kinase n=2 Tax=Paenibacillus TaxID=44249 RepID=A0ABY3AN99_PAEPP|nr:VWA domain-containing protein [Paenibacillus sp. SDF0028]
MLQPGTMLGNRYRVETLIAKGGMGAVYLVHDTKLNNKAWAMKEMMRHQGAEMFLEEAQLLSRLSHPNIPQIADYFEPDSEGRCYLVMEFIQGRTLQEIFQAAANQLPRHRIFKYMLQLCDILDYLHQQPKPIIFRDLKPSNMMIDEFDNIRLIDFGIARAYDQDKFADTVQMGTVAFAAPEQFERRQTDQRTDIYAMGAVLYYLLSKGKFYFQHRESIRTTLGDVTQETLDVLLKMLDPNPDRRYQRVREVREALLQIQVMYASAQVTETILMRTEAVTPSQLAAYPAKSRVREHEMVQREPYTTQATQSHPALVIYLLDVSGSMTLTDGGRRRIDVVRDALYVALRQMVFRSTKGSRISSRYRVAILAYSDEVHDLLDGIKRIDEVMGSGDLPNLRTYRYTNTADAFLYAEKLLQQELPFMQSCPAPLICHMTDGVYSGEDPEPIVRRIQAMSVPDGHVLVENIFISDDVLERAIDDPKCWSGVHDDTVFTDEYGVKLQKMSSVMPESYREMMLDANYHLTEGALLMFPGTNPDLVSLGFQMSAATPVR